MKGKILIIDDDRAFLTSLSDVLEEYGYEVRALTDPSEAAPEIEQFAPDLIILDVFMPKKSGFNLLRDFKDRDVYQDIPKILLTCLDDDVERMVAKSEGAAEYVTKPVDMDNFLSLVGELLS